MPRLEYRPIGGSGAAYPEWLRELRNKSGVYVIKKGSEVVYVGESKQRLYDTITRHFQRWRRKKQWWRDMFSRHDPGLTYGRDGASVAVRLVPAADRVRVQNALIRRLNPRDNIQGQEAPF